MQRTVFTTLVGLALSIPASGATRVEIGFEWFQPPFLPGYVTNDVELDFDKSLFIQQMSVQLTQGTVYQAIPSLGGTAPLGALIGPIPNLRYDSFVTLGGVIREASYPTRIVGGAPRLSGMTDLRFDSQGISIAWAPDLGVDIPSGEDFLTSRITLSADAWGAFIYLASTTDGIDQHVVMRPISNGYIGRPGAHPNAFPKVQDERLLQAAVGRQVEFQFSAKDAQTPDELEWELDHIVGTDGFHGYLDPAAWSLSKAGLFQWDTTDLPEGFYTITAKVNDPNGNAAIATLRIRLVPEPATLPLLWASIVAICRRRRSVG